MEKWERREFALLFGVAIGSGFGEQKSRISALTELSDNGKLTTTNSKRYFA